MKHENIFRRLREKLLKFLNDKLINIEVLRSLKLTYHLKMDGWNTNFLSGRPIFRAYDGATFVLGSVRGQHCTSSIKQPSTKQFRL